MNKIISFTLPFVLLFMAACSQEESLSVDNGEKGDRLVPVSIMLPSSSTHTQTRSGATEIGSERENKITALYLTLKFGTEVIEKDIVDTELKSLLEKSTTDSLGNPMLEVTCEVDFNVWNAASTIDATVFANSKNAPTPIPDASGENSLWIKIGDETAKDSVLFMSGHNATMAKTGGQVDLVRQVAKLRTKVGKTVDCIPANLEIKYKEIKVEVVNVADRSASLPGGTITGLQFITYAERVARNIIDVSDYSSSMQADSCYIHENKSSTATSLRITIPTYDPLTKHTVVLEREYQIKGGTGNQIERNHIYTLDIQVRSQKEPLDIYQNVQPWRVQTEDYPNLEPVITD